MDATWHPRRHFAQYRLGRDRVNGLYPEPPSAGCQDLDFFYEDIAV